MKNGPGFKIKNCGTTVITGRIERLFIIGLPKDASFGQCDYKESLILLSNKAIG